MKENILLCVVHRVEICPCSDPVIIVVCEVGLDPQGLLVVRSSYCYFIHSPAIIPKIKHCDFIAVDHWR